MSNTRNPNVKALVEWVRSDATHSEIAKALPSAITGDSARVSWVSRLERCFSTALARNPKLSECTKGSIATCVLELAEFGLMPNGRDAHLIPFNNKQPDNSYKLECSLIVDYKGFVTVLRDYCKAELVDGNVVYEGDEFDYQVGGNEDGSDRLVHRPNFPRTSQTPIAVYTRVKFRDSPTLIHVMDIEDVESKRRRSKMFSKGPNRTDPDDMRKRTCLKNMMKWLPRTDEFMRLNDIDNRHDPIEEDQRLTAEIDVDEQKQIEGEAQKQIDGAHAGVIGKIEELLVAATDDLEAEVGDSDLDQTLRQDGTLKPDQSWRELPLPVLEQVIARWDQLLKTEW